jgi:hypothetical protein
LQYIKLLATSGKELTGRSGLPLQLSPEGITYRSESRKARWHEEPLDFLRERILTNAIRCSLENFGAFDYHNPEVSEAVRHVQICPFYAISQMDSVLKTFNW